MRGIPKGFGQCGPGDILITLGEECSGAFAAEIAGDVVEKSKLVVFAFHKIASVLDECQFK